MKMQIIDFLSVLMLTIVFASCEHKELCYDHSHMVELDVRFDWSSAPDANPITMSLYLIPKGGGETTRYEFTKRSGGKIIVPAGSFHAVCVNGGIRNMECRNTGDINTFEITTTDSEMLQTLSALGLSHKITSRDEDVGDSRVVVAPEVMWSTCVVDLEFSKDSLHNISMQPKQIIEEVTLNISDIENLESVQYMSALLHGVSGGYYPGRDKISEERVILPFEFDINKDEGSIEGTFRTFGHCEDSDGAHILSIYALLKDGSEWNYTMDITEDIHKSDDSTMAWDVKMSGLPIPEVITGGGGLQPTVSQWETYEIPVQM